MDDRFHIIKGPGNSGHRLHTKVDLKYRKGKDNNLPISGVCVIGESTEADDTEALVQVPIKECQRGVGSLVGTIHFVDSACSVNCANVKFSGIGRVNAVKRMHISMTKNIPKGSPLVAHYPLAFPGGRCASCSRAIEALPAGQGGRVYTAIPEGWKRIRPEAGRDYEIHMEDESNERWAARPGPGDQGSRSNVRTTFSLLEHSRCSNSRRKQVLERSNSVLDWVLEHC